MTFSSRLNTLTDLGFRAGPYFVVLSMLVFGIQHFVYADPIMVGGLGPIWIPGRSVWAYATGVILIGGAAAILLKKEPRTVAIIVGLIVLAFTILFFAPMVIADLASGFAWTISLKGFSLCGSMLLVAAASEPEWPVWPGTRWLILIASTFLGVTMVVFGIEHFIYVEFTTELVPTWIPARQFWAYFCGVALIVAGVSILTKRLAVPGATFLGVMIFLWVVVLHIPRSIELEKVSEWTNTFNALTMSGGAFMLAGLLKRGEATRSRKMPSTIF